MSGRFGRALRANVEDDGRLMAVTPSVMRAPVVRLGEDVSPLFVPPSPTPGRQLGAPGRSYPGVRFPTGPTLGEGGEEEEEEGEGEEDGAGGEGVSGNV